ncbi:MAG: glycogen debranching protein GlgX [Pseudomonadales bacterium]|nr:glycogen debranching protein GlgX [Pseudomonadales bacterium]
MKLPSHLQPGDPTQLGGRCLEDGVNFAVYSEHAQAIDVCLFNAHDDEIGRMPLPAHDNGVWHGFLPRAGAGLRYGLRAHGIHDPGRGLYFDASKLLIDPWTTAVSGSYLPGGGGADNARCMPKSVVVDSRVRPVRNRPATNLPPLFYEAHVRGLTRMRGDVHPRWQGTYRGLAQPSVIAHLKSLGVTVLELMPVQYFVDEPHLVARGLTNYWGYNPAAFMAVHPGYAACVDDAIGELRMAVDALHDAGIEVVLDVVFNHSAEGGADGPILSLRGLDNPVYYRMHGGDFINDTGCGNTLNVDHPTVQRLVVDSLKQFALHAGVDGFRFDLAVTLGRTPDGFAPTHPLLARIAADPVVGSLRLIAEPWDIGPGGYQLGGFPSPWGEWNDRFRDTVRAYWRGDHGLQAEFSRRIHGSSELFDRPGRRPSDSIHFVTAHDGYVLQDVVSYVHRHNAINGEDNRDGHAHNLSDNFGEEGGSDNPDIRQARERRKRAMLASLLLAQGTPMLLAGDEAGNTQYGNNNAYCQDNHVGWVRWDLAARHGDLTAFIRNLSGLRRELASADIAAFIHTDFDGDACQWVGGRCIAVGWLRADALPMTPGDWHAADCPFGLLWKVDARHELFCFNRSTEPVRFHLPEAPAAWRCVFDSAMADGVADRQPENREISVDAQSVLVLVTGMTDETG